MATSADRAVEGGPAQPVYITNTVLPAAGDKTGTSIGMVDQGVAGATPWAVRQAQLTAANDTVKAAQIGSIVTTATLQAAATATGNGTSLDVSGMAVAVLQTAGTFVGTVTFEASTDDSLWVAIPGETLSTGAIVSTATTTNAVIGFRVAGYKSLRARISAYTSGSITVTGRAQAVDAALPIQQAALYNSAGTAIGAPTSADSISMSTSLSAAAFGFLFNGTTWDRQRNNYDFIFLTTAARTASVNSSIMVNYNARYLRIEIDVTVIVASPSIVAALQVFDQATGVYTTILASAAIVAVGHTILQVGPGLPDTANLSANKVIGRQFRVAVTHGNADSITYSVSASLNN